MPNALNSEWALEIVAMINTGLELCGASRRVQSCQRGYHEIASEILHAGLNVIDGDCECSMAATKIASCHLAGQDWGMLINDTLIAAQRADPSSARQWIAQAAAKSAHSPNEGCPRDIALTAAWVVNLYKNRLEGWNCIANIVDPASINSNKIHDLSSVNSNQSSTKISSIPPLLENGKRWHQALAMVLRRYGFLALDIDGGTGAITKSLSIIHPDFDDISAFGDLCTVVFLNRAEYAHMLGLDVQHENSTELLFKPMRSWFGKQRPIYSPLLDYFSFSGNGLIPLLNTRSGRTVVGWLAHNGKRKLVVGLDFVEELVRYTQGNPARVSFSGNRNLWGAGHEQASYLYDGHIVPKHEMEPWADNLGFLLAESIAAEANIPLISPLPGGVQGGIILTGDDDQAWLEKYDEQLSILGDFPITYCMLPWTNHTPETLKHLPETVEFGVHVDALERPEEYAELCIQQTTEVRQLLGDRSVHVIRNHGHLNHDYWGHLSAWEAADLSFGLNIRGLDGTCTTGSYLPFRVRRLDGSWSAHTSLFSTFSDSMLFQQKWPEKKQIKIIKTLANSIESGRPGIIVFNFHPQNVSQFTQVLSAVMSIGNRQNWRAFGAESFRRWLESVDGISMKEIDGRLILLSKDPVHDLAVRWPKSSNFLTLPTWHDSIYLDFKSE